MTTFLQELSCSFHFNNMDKPGRVVQQTKDRKDSEVILMLYFFLERLGRTVNYKRSYSLLSHLFRIPSSPQATVMHFPDETTYEQSKTIKLNRT